ncbi:MAG: 6,7-dimethyl-8-ribityllumazine synthase [Chloroflexi bacterium]|nr:6,7-dimethyl-8-ribityllumazine synthase [Chloroflexota bacterium]
MSEPPPSAALEPDSKGEGHRFAIVVARFNQFVTSQLLKGAREGLLAHGVKERDIFVAWVPGSFELPLIAQKLARTGRFSAVICLGAIIRGETPHFEYVAAEAARGIADASRASQVPILFGVLTTDTAGQALARAGGKGGNKGYDAALAAIEMANLTRAIGALGNP